MSNRLVKGADIPGIRVIGHEGVKIGAVREVFIDLSNGTVAFIIVELATLLVSSGKFHPAPLSELHYDPAMAAFQTGLTKEQFKAAPSYDRDQLADENIGWPDQAIRYFATVMQQT